MNYQFELLQATRQNAYQLLEGLTMEQLNHIPEGYNNNLLWNAGHILATHQRLVYRLAGQEMRLPVDFTEAFRKGTRPEGPYDEETIQFIRENLLPTAQQAAIDYDRGLFLSFSPYTASYGAELRSIEQAITFNNVHEGLHLGYMMALRKLV